jgi:hypothetical protein
VQLTPIRSVNGTHTRCRSGMSGQMVCWRDHDTMGRVGSGCASELLQLDGRLSLPVLDSDILAGLS